MSTPSSLEADIRGRLAAGNALAANDLAASVLGRSGDTPTIRYLYLLSLAACGATQRALARYEELAPPPEARDEDWQALPARLHKDLAFGGIDAARHLAIAARLYREAHGRTGGTFTGINAATLSDLSGNEAEARSLAERVLKETGAHAPGDARGAYYWHATRAEALILLDRIEAAEAELDAADALLREDLTARSRTRQQLARILARRRPGERIERRIRLPSAYLLDPDAVGTEIPELPAELAVRLKDSPVFMTAPVSAAAVVAARRVLEAGARIHAAVPELDDGRAAEGAVARPVPSTEFLESVEQQSVLAGFLRDEHAWQHARARRFVQGLARASATGMGTELHALTVTGRDGDRSWAVAPEPAPPVSAPPPGRLMVGLVFADVVGFSRFSDTDIRAYWRDVVPEFARALAPWKRSILRRQTWGDALHLVTRDPRSAAWITLTLLEAVRKVRAGGSGRLANLEMRIGAHYAPASEGADAVEGLTTYYGTQLSFTARVEPVTPPGTVYVTESFLAELELQCPGEFRAEYAGELPLAKRYGMFRLFSLKARLGRPAAEAAVTLTIGVTGHLGLDAAARARVSQAVAPYLRRRLAGVARVRVLSGLAPGADLVLTDAIDKAAASEGAALSLRALLVDEPDSMIGHWLRRAAELGDAPSPQAQASVRELFQQWLARAHERVNLFESGAPHEPAFQRLGAHLAREPDVLVAVLRPSHQGQRGGTAEVVAWRRDPSRIPAGLAAELDPGGRELVLVDPDTGRLEAA